MFSRAAQSSVFGLAGLLCLTLQAVTVQAAERPNILWITSEDNGPHLGCYGDQYATTPNLDALAERGLLYLYCWSNAPVCAPARTTLISGVYPPATGAEHMRSMTRLPAALKMYPQILRAAGYYCTNNSKEDYNLAKPEPIWDESSRRAHWKNRRGDQPFFAIFNHTISHESKLRTRPHQAVHDPAQVRVPAYHPDIPEVRQDWAQYYDRITEMDALAGKNLAELEAAGEAENTIVFYYGDHGSGMPRSKRWPYNSGLHVPLIVYIPAKFQHLRPAEYVAGGTSSRLVSFVDLAPTVLSLAGIAPPKTMQGYAFAGSHATQAQPYIHGFRGRMDERYDLVRSIRDQRYIYIRNYMPHKIYGQYIQYMFQTPTTRRWKELFDAGQLNTAQQAFWKTKPPEELYDLQQDPDEVHNLAGSAEHQDILKRLRAAQQAHVRRIRDVGFLPEDEIHNRRPELTPYELGRDPVAYPLDQIHSAAELASLPQPDDLPAVRGLLKQPDSAVRYWGAMGLLIRGPRAVEAARADLREALGDESWSVRVIAAEALGRYGQRADVQAALPVLLEAADLNQHGVYIAMLALNALDHLDQRAASVKNEIAALPTASAESSGRKKAYVPNLIKKTLADLD